MKQNAAAPERVISGGLFSLLSLMLLASMVSSKFTVYGVFLCLSLGFCAVTLFLKSRNVLGVIALGLVTVAFLVLVISGFPQHLYHYMSGTYKNPEFHFHPLYLLPFLVLLAAWVLMTWHAAVQFLGINDGQLSKRCWFLPALLLILAVLLLFGIDAITRERWVGFDSILTILMLHVLMLPGFLLFSLWILGEDPQGYYPIHRHLALMLFTLGLWCLVWVWHNTLYLNRVENEEPRRPTLTLLLCIFLPFYVFYWHYASAQRVDRLAKSRGVESRLAVLCLVLGLLLPFLPSVLMQDKINRICLVESGRFAPDLQAAPAASQPIAVNPAVFDEPLPDL